MTKVGMIESVLSVAQMSVDSTRIDRAAREMCFEEVRLAYRDMKDFQKKHTEVETISKAREIGKYLIS